MISGFFHSVIYEPIYNALAFLVSSIPGGDVGIAIILITIVVKLILFPLALKASHTQRSMRALEPQMKNLKEKHKDSSETLARATLALYSEHKVNPFASILILFIQIPVILGLYWVILAESQSTGFDPSLLYSFVTAPEASSFVFLGLIDLAKGSILLSVLVGITQFIQARLMMPNAPEKSGKGFQDDLASSMHIQMRYVLPVVLAVVAYVASAAIALYFLTSNIFGIIQEVVAHRTHTIKKPS
ncbi:MAG: YidC/Oxa1 family membrane protein insertase [Patescibacteria group bacterium]